MATKTSNELIVRYLLGDLPEDEQVQLEDRAFTDREYLRNIEDVENDLIDEYVRGALSETKRRQFEHRFLASAERQKKVEFARALARVVPAPDKIAPPTTAPWWELFTNFLHGLNPIWQFSLAAATLFLLLGVVWLFTRNSELRTQIAQLQIQQQAQQQQAETLRQQTSHERAHNQELTEQLERERTHNQELTQQLERAKPPGSPTAPTLSLSFFLPPGISRGADKRSKLTLPPTAQKVRLQIGLERGDDFKNYRVAISTAQGRKVWAQELLQPRGRTITTTIPSQLLRTGQYELALKGTTEAQQIEDVRFYYFDVLRK